MDNHKASPYHDLDIDETLRVILEGTATKTGKDFFRDLVLNLSRALNTYGAWITEIESDEKANSIAFILKGKWIENYEYRIKGTPCEPVIKQREIAHIPDSVLKLYPGDPDIKAITPKPLSYMGVPLIDKNNKILGHIAVLDCKPMPENQRYISLMKIFASRAVAELQRLKAESKIREREQKLSRLLESAMDAIIEIDENLRITQINNAAIKIFNSTPDKVVGRNFSSLLTKSSVEKILNITDELKSKKSGEKYLWIPKGLDAVKTDGTIFRAEVTISLYELNENKYYALILRNINDRLEAEKKIETLSMEAEYLKEEIKSVHNFEAIIGKSRSLIDVISDVKKVAKTDTTVLITGETGTGKELVARLIQGESGRKNRSLIKVNCAAIPSNLIESEFFGHEKGAFTGATSKRDGRFLYADNGTIFLDEIGELPIDLQPKLLRVLQDGEFEPVGSSKTIKVNVRVIAATNRDLFKEVKSGRFREDLYYRLNVFPVKVPPLRERGDDVIRLAEAFSSKFAANLGIDLKPLSDKDIYALKGYDWPGNIRELQNIIERAVITSQNGILEISNAMPRTYHSEYLNNGSSDDAPKQIIYTSGDLKKLERDNIINALDKTEWKISGDDGAASLLGIPPTTLNSRIKALNIKKPDN